MSTSSSSKRRQFWRADWIVGACIAAAAMVLWKPTGLLEALGRRLCDIASIPSSREPSDRIAVIASSTVASTFGAAPDEPGAATSYDPPAKVAVADDSFAKPAVFGRPTGSVHPAGGGGQSGDRAMRRGQP